MSRHEESSCRSGGKGKAPVNSLDRLARTSSGAPEVLAMANQFAALNTGNLHSRPLQPLPAGTPTPAPAPNETTTLVGQLHFAEVRRPQAFDHEARPPSVVAETERRSNISSLARLFKKRPKPKDPPSKPHPKSRNTGNAEEESEKEDGIVGLLNPPGANTQRASFATNASKKDSGTGIKPPRTVAPGQTTRAGVNSINPPNRVMSPGIAEEYVVATRTLGVPDVAPPRRSQTPIISRRRGRAYSAQYLERFQEPFEDA
ncbi:hypothetical protein HBI47_068370 [Parastagonospora nodorum]|nr:hypothetical protein HBI47_068370 [Parastagonospora nodorum]